VQANWRLVFLVNVPVGLAGLVAGYRVLAERRELGALRPDLLGAGGFVIAVARWCWRLSRASNGDGPPAGVGLLIGSIALLAGSGPRLGQPPLAADRPEMLRVRSFSLPWVPQFCSSPASRRCSSTASCSSPTVWHESVLTTGLMLSPAPSGGDLQHPLGPVGRAVGYRIPGVAGATLFLVASLWWVTRTHGAPAYLSEYLPGMAISGGPVGLVIPRTLTGRGPRPRLAPERFRHRRRRADDGAAGRLGAGDRPAGRGARSRRDDAV